MKLKNIIVSSFLFILFAGNFSHAQESRNFRAISYNAWGLPVPFLSKPSRFKKITGSIGDFNADVIGFQETFTKFANVLKETEGYPYQLQGPGKKGIKILSSGLLMLSKFPIVESDALIFSKCSGMDCFARKGVTWAKINVPGFGFINVFNTHTNAGSNNKVKMHQLTEANEFVQKHLGGRPALFLGDFNLKPGSEYYNYVHYVMDFKDTLDLYLLENPRYANDPTVIYTYRIGKKFYRGRLDYFWLKDGDNATITPLNYSVIFNKINGQKLSDHFGIMSDFQLSQN